MLENKKSKYEIQAENFLNETGTTFAAVKIGHFPYFDGDKESRDVYQVTLTRGEKVYSFRFGQSIHNSEGNPKELRAYKGTKQYQRLISEGYKPSKVMADYLIKKSTPITAYDVLACLQNYDPGTFSDFCSEMGYDTDSKKAEKTYFAVQDEYKNINNLFSDVMDKLAEIA